MALLTRPRPQRARPTRSDRVRAHPTQPSHL